jgi:uncharacterized protein
MKSARENNALIIFVKNPVLGKVKTRLAKTLGDQKALEIYLELLSFTHKVTSGLDCGKFVFYADHVDQDDIWQNGGYIKKPQSGKDLGERMQNAFQSVFEEGHDKALIIGSDCAEITTEIIQEAFAHLEQKDVVVGPAKDGGYYLLGLKAMQGSLFQNMPWSSSEVLDLTLRKTNESGLTFSLLPELSDIDEEKDLPAHFKWTTH